MIQFPSWATVSSSIHEDDYFLTVGRISSSEVEGIHRSPSIPTSQKLPDPSWPGVRLGSQMSLPVDSFNFRRSSPIIYRETLIFINRGVEDRLKLKEILWSPIDRPRGTTVYDFFLINKKIRVRRKEDESDSSLASTPDDRRRGPADQEKLAQGSSEFRRLKLLCPPTETIFVFSIE